MKKKETKDFLLGAFVGSVIGIAAASLSKSKSKQLLNSLTQAGKALSLTSGEKGLAQIIDWTSEGIKLWSQMKKQTKKGR